MKIIDLLDEERRTEREKAEKAKEDFALIWANGRIRSGGDAVGVRRIDPRNHGYAESFTIRSLAKGCWGPLEYEHADDAKDRTMRCDTAVIEAKDGRFTFGIVPTDPDLRKLGHAVERKAKWPYSADQTVPIDDGTFMMDGRLWFFDGKDKVFRFRLDYATFADATAFRSWNRKVGLKEDWENLFAWSVVFTTDGKVRAKQRIVPFKTFGFENDSLWVEGKTSREEMEKTIEKLKSLLRLPIPNSEVIEFVPICKGSCAKNPPYMIPYTIESKTVSNGSERLATAIERLKKTPQYIEGLKTLERKALEKKKATATVEDPKPKPEIEIAEETPSDDEKPKKKGFFSKLFGK